jgi:5'-nucleotidase (lipoprotein e(P4) family)
MPNRIRAAACGLLILLAACSPTRPSAPAAFSNELPRPVSAAPGVVWYRAAAERRAIYEQVFAQARQQLPKLVGARAAGTWAVIADADETLLDNSEHQLYMARNAIAFDDAGWKTWVDQRRARALPGSIAFVDAVIAAGGRVIVVTNRSENLCEQTRDNLASVGLRVAAVLCAPWDDINAKWLSDKNPRFQRVRAGLTDFGLPALEVVAWLGDNIQDFPGLTQQNAEPLAEFGVRYFMFPNPMYGSWEKLPVR